MKPTDLDHYYQKAKKLGYVARSVFKLEELNQKHRFLKKGQKILDLGAAPGSWMQYTSKIIGSKGKLLGVDLAELSIPLESNMAFIQQDIFELNYSKLKEDYGMFDGILSDMAPKTSGNKLKDHLESLDLCRMALGVTERCLKPGGFFICKLFDGEDLQPFILEEIQPRFSKQKLQKPKASRRTSVEKYLVAQR